MGTLSAMGLRFHGLADRQGVLRCDVTRALGVARAVYRVFISLHDGFYQVLKGVIYERFAFPSAAEATFVAIMAVYLSGSVVKTRPHSCLPSMTNERGAFTGISSHRAGRK